LTLAPYKPPQVKTRLRRQYALNVGADSGGAAGEYTYVCGPIPFPYRIIAVILPQCWQLFANTVQCYFFVSDNDAGNFWPMTDEDILSFTPLQGGTIANWYEQPRIMEMDYVVNRTNTYLKFHARKLIGGPIWFTAIFIIEDLREVPT
jgi:hypothetical protein